MPYYAPPYTTYAPGYYAPGAPVPDQLSQLRAAQQMGPGMQQGGQIPPQQMPAQQQAGNGIIWVQGEAGAKSYMVAPGNSVLLMDSESFTFYLKSVDASGMPSMRMFDYTERVAAPAQPQAPAPDYVTHAELEALTARMEAKLEAMTAPNRRRGAKEETDNAEPAV